MDIQQIIEDACNKYEQDKYAMYLRKSRADLEMEALGEGETLARHKAMLDAVAAKHNIHPDQITVYRELVSGESIDERPEMQRLLADVYAKNFKGVLVVEIERLARGNTRDQGEVADAFSYSSTHIITPSKVYDPNNEFDQEYFEFGLFMSRREYKTIKRRMLAGKIQAVKEGNYIGTNPPYGFDIVRKTKKERVLVENPEESRIVKMIFNWYTIDQKSTGWIARELTKMGIKTRQNKPQWSRNTIRDIVLNVHYTGKVSWYAQKTVREMDPKTGKLVKKRINTNDFEVYEGKHDGFISQEQFDLAQALTGTHTPLRQDFALRNPLSRIMVCADCGMCMGLQRYPCGTKPARFSHARNTICKKKSLPVGDVLNELVNALNEYIADFQMRMDNGHDQTKLVRHQEMIQALESELKKQERKKARLFDSWEADDGTYTRDEFIERKQMYAAAIDRLKEQIKEAKDSAPAPVDYKAQIANIHALIDCIKDPNLDAQAKNDFLSMYIDKITYDVIDYGVNKGGKPVLEVYLK